MNILPSLKNHIALHSSVEVDQICQPLKEIGIQMFCYHKVFHDGTEIMLSNHSAWAEHYYKEAYLIHTTELNSIDFFSGFNYVLWPSENLVNILSQVRSICNIHHGISLISNGSHYTEGFGFATNLNTSFGVNLLLHNIDLLARFSLYFKNIAFDIIKKCNGSKILHPETNRILPVKNILNEQMDYWEKFIANTPIQEQEKFDIQQNKKIFELKINTNTESSFNNFNLSKRESQCVNLLLRGQTIKMVGESLNLSPRTVEHYMENIKAKFRVNSKAALIEKIIYLNKMN